MAAKKVNEAVELDVASVIDGAVPEETVKGKAEVSGVEENEAAQTETIPEEAKEERDQMVTEETKAEKSEETAEEKPTRRRRRRNADGADNDGIIEASRKEQRERRRELEDVFVKDPNASSAPVDPVHQDFLELAASQKNKIVRTGELSAVSVTQDGYAIAKIKYGHFVVMIPATQLFVMSESGVKDGGVNSSYAYYASRRIGAPIDFIVEQVDESKKIAVASRLAAMQQISRRYYVEKHNGEPFITPGKIVEATVVYRMETGIGVEAFGAEVFIHNEELSWNRVKDARREDFAVGQRVIIKILEVQNIDYSVGDRAYHLIGLRASVKQATADPNEEYYDAIQVGDVSTGVVTNVEAKIGYFVVLDAWPRTIVCQFTQSDRVIPIGSKVVVKIARKVDNNKWIYGRITDILKTPDVSWY